MSLERRLGIACIALALSGGASAQPSSPPDLARAAERLEATWRSHGAPAFSEAVSQGGRLVFSEGRGFADLEHLVPATGATVYDIGSVSKVQTAVAVMQLVEQGKVRLNDPIQAYVPSFPDKGTPITIRHLMTHTSGIRHYRAGDFPGTPDNENVRPYTSLEAAIAIFKDDPLLFRPGQYYGYSSYAVNLLQGVVEKAGGLPFEEYMRRFVWGPAGMLATQFDIPERVIPHRARSYVTRTGPVRNVPYGDLTYKFASGGMMSTAEDLVRFATGLNEGRLLKPETLAQVYSPQIDGLRVFRDGKVTDEKATGQGLLWLIRSDDAGRRFVYHCGSVQAFQACLVNYPERNLAVAILANSWDATGWKENLAVAELFLESGLAP
jgi:CubicO group peptidase (beta-lactamase class C family)